jgi:hypothetical protein
MEVPPLVLQTAGSLMAILALAALARRMRLGGAPVLSDAASLQRAAGEVVDGFEVSAFAISQDRTCALTSDSEGRIMLIRRHGNRFAGRILGPAAKARQLDGTLEVDCGERRFGACQLLIDDPAAWAELINQLHEHHDA